MATSASTFGRDAKVHLNG